MENLKQFMAFPMGLTAIWLFWILSVQLNRFDLSLVLVGSLVTIFINFTADWCITCKVNEARVLKSSTVLEYLDTNKIDYIVYDWTERNENISAVLESYGRSGVPLYLLFKGDGTDAIILPEILTETMVLNALRKL